MIAQYFDGGIILIGIVLSAIGNFRQTKTSTKLIRLTSSKHMEMTSDFRGI